MTTVSKIAFIQMGDFKRIVEVANCYYLKDGRITIEDKNGNEYETHISNVIIEKKFGHKAV